VSPPASPYAYSLEDEQQLINSVRTGDSSRAATMVTGVLQHGRAGRGGGTPKRVAYDLASTLLKAAAAVAGPGQAEAGREMAALDAAIENGSAAEIEEAFLRATRTLCRLVQEEKSRRDPRQEFVEKVQRYIVEHYTDPNLCISSIADAFGITPDYLSRLYRDRTGDGILDRINEVRLDIARRLLVESERSIKEIAGEAGYTNTTTFTRIFKRHEGVTPGEYKVITARRPPPGSAD
jgi:two-component system, response regulator YesN